MRHCLPLALTLLTTWLAACSRDTPDIAGSAACDYPLVTLETGGDSSCDGGGSHRWPIGMLPTDCHGWRATDTWGSVHDNSANNIHCLPDGSFEFTQFPGNINCEGTGTVKRYTAGVCEQDTPPSLYTVASDLTCCTDPTAPACTTGSPTVDRDEAQVALNGEGCAE